MKNLFIVGCPRSGTTALGDLLNADPRIVIGRERYKFIMDRITPEHFNKTAFLNPTSEQTNFLAPAHFEPLREKWDGGNLVYVGDKVPHYCYRLPYLARTFPGAGILFLQRDLLAVANSFTARARAPEDHWPMRNDYRVAVDHWEKALFHVKNFLESPAAPALFIVRYEAFYSGQMEYLEALYRHLELDLIDEVREKFVELTAGWRGRPASDVALTDGEVAWVEARRNHALESWARERLPIVPKD